MHISRPLKASRGKWLVGLTLGTLMLLPPALAWACNPQAHINLNASTYSPGQPMTIYGSYFPGGKTITVVGPTGSVSATTSPGGAFSVGMTAPSTPGNYVVSATKPTGGTAPASFSVASAPAASTSTSVGSSAVPSTAAPSKSPTFSAPSVHRSVVPAKHHAAAPAPAVTPTPVVPATVTPSPVVAAAPVATSTPVVAATHATTHKTAARHSAARSTAPATSQLAATSDLWSGFARNRSASLTSAGAAGMSSGGPSSALTVGIAVAAIALFGLVAGLSAAEVRRRRLSSR